MANTSGAPVYLNHGIGVACRFCGGPPVDEIDAGGDVGVCCRSCFVAWDDAAEASEHLEQWHAHMLGELLPPEVPRFQKKVLDRVGQRFGSFVVIGDTYRARPSSGKLVRHWRLECDCGETVLVPTYELGKPGRRDGEQCGACTRRRLGLARAARYGGLSISELAARAGCTENAIRGRIKNGWTTERLLAPSRFAAPDLRAA